MTTDTPVEPTTPGSSRDARPEALADQLRWVHDLLRRDLDTLQQLAARVRAGAPAATVRGELRALQSNGPLFRLSVNCLSFCQTVHSHHRNEDAVLFPAVRQAAPHLFATVDRLEADHRIVAALLDDVERLAHRLAAPPARRALVDALESLSGNLLRHLELEEAALQPVLESWSRWPESAPADIRGATRPAGG